MELRFTRPAHQDIASILEYIGDRSPQGARRVLHSFEQAFQRLLFFPESGRDTGRGDQTRQVVIATFPFIVIYRVQGEVIEILRVRHTARDPDTILDI